MRAVWKRAALAVVCGAMLWTPLGARTQPAPSAPAAPPALSPLPAAAQPTPAQPGATLPGAPASPALPPGVRLAPGQPIPPAELEAFVDGVVRESMAKNHIAGVTVSVVQNGQLLLKKGYGFASLAPVRPVDPDLTMFRIGSISKTFTWMLVLKQVEAGHMRLDAPINLYLPEALRVPDQGFTRPIRVQNLMNHTPGFEDRAVGQLFEKDFARVRPLAVYLRHERPRRVREPGGLPSYSNYGAGLAGEAVAEVSGMPYETLVEAQILGPLGLAHTSFREPHPAAKGLPAPLSPQLARNVSDAFHWTPLGFQKRPFEYLEQVGPAGAASSTAGDMARYMMLLLAGGTLDGVTLYGPATAHAFATPLPTPAPGVTAWRHGMVEYALPGDFTGVGHSGGTLSFLSNMVVVPRLGLGVFVSTNTDTGGNLSGVLPARIVEHFYVAPPGAPAKGSPELVSRRGDFEGAYLTTRRAYSGLEGFLFRLIGGAKVSVTQDGRLILSGFDGASRWAPDGPVANGRFVSDEGPVHLIFQFKDGKAERFFASWGGAAYERIGLLQQTGPLILLSVITAIAALATLIGLVWRVRRDYRESTTQQRASLLQASQAFLWLMAMVLLAVWAAGSSDIANVMYNWPGVPLVLASASALVASVMAAASLVMLPFIWRGGRRVDSWTAGRKIRFTVTALIFVAYAGLLFAWGALEPWSG